ncbi:MAG: PxKF domain-containing protein [Acidobacteria bacterium]|nr:PxKF domain-containing protein [Acidobacteriota bacterium]
MKSSNRLFVVVTALALFGCVTLSPVPAVAHSIDYVSTNISPAATFAGSSGNWTVNGTVTGGSNITFTLTFGIDTQGSTTTYPRTVTFGATTEVKPSGASDAVVSPATPSCTFTTSATTCPTNYTITAPTTAGTYTVKIQAATGTGGAQGLGGGSGVSITFTVAVPVASAEATTLTLSVGNGGCVVLHSSTNVSISATLVTTVGSTPVANKSISFFIDSASAGSAFTDVNGVATIAFNPSTLALGDHTVTASFAGDSLYEASGDNANLGITYVFVGFQQPINADGTSIFGGRTVSTKIRITDALNYAISNAAAHVFFAYGTPTVVGTDAEPVANTNGDTGNAMRYDYTANQYIFNWDIAGLPNGTYSIRVDLAEGSCGAAHTAVVSLQKKGSK